MRDHPIVDCARAEPLLTEVALGIAQRSDAELVAGHLERCASCAEAFTGLATVVDALTELIPDVQPPPGFTARVTQGFAPAADERKRSLRLTRVVGIVASCIVLALGFGLGALVFSGSSTSPGSTTAFVTADFHGAAGVQGQVVVSKSSPGWLIASLSGMKSTRWVSCDLILDNGKRIDVGEFTARSEYPSWSAPVPHTDTPIRSVDIVNGSGHLIASATLT